MSLGLGITHSHPDWVELDRGSLSPEEASARAAARSGIAAARLRALLAGMPRTILPMPASLALVRDLRSAGHRLFVLSNQHGASLACLQDTCDFFARFEGRVVPCEVGCCKPEATIYHRLLEKFALDPGATVFVDDSPANLDAAAL